MTDPTALHRAFVDGLARRGAFGRPGIEAAFRTVRRHHFLPDIPADQAYRDQVVVTKVDDGLPISASSQPSFMAVMLEQLELEPGHRVLEIGAGTGYNAALLAHMVGRKGRVVTLDIDRDVAERARSGLRRAGYPGVDVICGDGGLGHAAGAPYDRVIVTVSAGDIAPALREQLGPDGRLVIPLSLRGPQRSIAFRRVGDVLYGVSIAECDFGTSLRGQFGGTHTRVSVDREDRCWLWFEGERALDRGAIEGWLSGDSADVRSGRRARIAEIFGGLYLWLALHDERFVQIGSTGPTRVPALLALPGKLALTAGLLDATGLAVLTPGASKPATSLEDHRGLGLTIRGFGAAGSVVRGLTDLIRAWHEAGRPETAGLSVVAYPGDGEYRPSAGELVIDKRWSRLVLAW